MFTQVVGTLFRLAAEHEAIWREVSGSRAVPVVGEPEPVEPEAITVDPARLRAKAESLSADQKSLWKDVLSAPAPSAVGPDAWARIVFDFLAAALQRPGEGERLARGLLPLYYARVAEFVDEARDMTTTQSEEIVELGALAMEKEKIERMAERDTARTQA